MTELFECPRGIIFQRRGSNQHMSIHLPDEVRATIENENDLEAYVDKVLAELNAE